MATQQIAWGLVWAWYNVTKATEGEAVEFAKLALGDAAEAAEALIFTWNIQEATP